MQEVSEFVGEAWSRAGQTWQGVTPLASWWLWVAVVAVALIATRSRNVETWVTLLHEAGHAVVALLTGRRLHGLHLHADGSGVVWSSGGRASRILVAAAGYPAPAWVGAGLLAALIAGSFGAAGIVVGAVALLLLPWARTARAVLALFAVVAAVAGLIWWQPSGVVVQGAALTLGLLAAIAVVGGWRALFTERRARRSGTHTDVATLAEVTPLPAAVWWLLLTSATFAAAVPIVRSAQVLTTAAPDLPFG